MQRIKLTVTYTIEYKPDPNDYKPDRTIEEMAEIDLANFESNPREWVNSAEGIGNVEASYEILDRE